MYQDITTRIITVLRENFGAYFKTYFDGDPVAIGLSSLPAVIVTTEAEQWELGPTQHDNVGQQVIIKLVMNKLDDFGASPDVDQTEKKLRLLVKGRDENSLLLPESVVGSLRTNFTLSETLLDQTIAIEYGVMPRPDDVLTSEAHITITTKEIQHIPNRS